MSLSVILLLIVLLGATAWLFARAKARSFALGDAGRPHSLPVYHGWYVALWAIIPAIVFLSVWSGILGGLVTDSVLESPQAASLPSDPMHRAAVLGEARALSQGRIQAAFNPEAAQLAPLYRDATRYYSLIGGGIALLLAFATGAFGFSRISPHFRARTRV